MPYVFLTGGARSGKSTAAERKALSASAPVTVIATAERGDAEMTARIERHRAARPAHWTTIEETVNLVDAVASTPPNSFVVVDCLTLWLANVLGSTTDAQVAADARELATALADRTGEAVVVSNEVGDGIVPADPTTRRYRDLLGLVNSEMAASASESYLVVAGRFLRLDEPAW